MDRNGGGRTVLMREDGREAELSDHDAIVARRSVMPSSMPRTLGDASRTELGATTQPQALNAEACLTNPLSSEAVRASTNETGSFKNTVETDEGSMVATACPRDSTRILSCTAC